MNFHQFLQGTSLCKCSSLALPLSSTRPASRTRSNLLSLFALLADQVAVAALEDPAGGRHHLRRREAAVVLKKEKNNFCQELHPPHSRLGTQNLSQGWSCVESSARRVLPFHRAGQTCPVVVWWPSKQSSPPNIGISKVLKQTCSSSSILWSWATCEQTSFDVGEIASSVLCSLAMCFCASFISKSCCHLSCYHSQTFFHRLVKKCLRVVLREQHWMVRC